MHDRYFGEEAVDLCTVCGIELYPLDTIYHDCTNDEHLCEDCVAEHLGVKQNDDDTFEPCRCPHCNSLLTDMFESVTVDKERFCDTQCAYVYLDIEIIGGC